MICFAVFVGFLTFTVLEQSVIFLLLKTRDLRFGTTEEFLRSFGVNSIDNLPVLNPVQLEEFKQEAEAEMNVTMNI